MIPIQKPIPKIKPVRSERYLKFIRLKPCLIGVGCVGPVEAAHINFDGSTMGSKGSDLYCIPLCVGHHRGDISAHSIGDKPFFRMCPVVPEIAALKLLNEFFSLGGKL